MNNTTRRRPAAIKRLLAFSTLHGLLNANRAFSALALAVTLSLPGQLHAQTAPQTATGEVVGRVLNPATGRYLNNARITADGTNATAFTNDYGEYRLQGVPAGEAKLHIFYSGLGEQTVTVTVPAGQTVTRIFPSGRRPLRINPWCSIRSRLPGSATRTSRPSPSTSSGSPPTSRR